MEQQAIYEYDDGSYLTESELASILCSQLEQLFSEATKIFLGLQQATPEQKLTIDATKKEFELGDTIGAVFTQTIANIACDLFDEQFKDIAEKNIHSVNEYFNIDLEESVISINPQTVYSDYINRMMKH
jgi:hypothetical protein